jgi:hypothetical protein
VPRTLPRNTRPIGRVRSATRECELARGRAGRPVLAEVAPVKVVSEAMDEIVVILG